MSTLIYETYGLVFGLRHSNLKPKAMCLGSVMVTNDPMSEWICALEGSSWICPLQHHPWILPSKLLAKPDQGKVYEVTSATNLPNHFLQSDFTCLADCRFIHPAQLDCVPLNRSQRFSNRKRKWRRCGYATKTLLYILRHCKPYLVSII